MATITTETSGYVLSQDVLDHCYQRAPIYDRENRFFDEDFKELREAGYLTRAVPGNWAAGACPWLKSAGSNGTWPTTLMPLPWR
jgi:hypothetical protein